MKIRGYCLLIGCSILLSGCAFDNHPLALAPVGPQPLPELNGPGQGGLQVYSAWDALDNRYRRSHSDYKIFASDGKLVKRVSNSICFDDYDPVEVQLPAGEYRILAMSQSAGRVLVPVRIAAGLTTSVYLDGYDYLRNSLIGSNHVVKLPDGQIVGWAATGAHNP